MLEDRFLKRLSKEARRGLRGWPIATIAFYGPNLSQATKVAVGIVPSENAAVEELRDWKVDRGDIRRSRNCRPDTRLYRETSGAISSDDGSHNWVSSPGRNRLRRRMVSSLRVLARTRSLYGAEGTLILQKIVFGKYAQHFLRIVHPAGGWPTPLATPRCGIPPTCV